MCQIVLAEESVTHNHQAGTLSLILDDSHKPAELWVRYRVGQFELAYFQLLGIECDSDLDDLLLAAFCQLPFELKGESWR